MNLKESFRYQSFLDHLMEEATSSLTMREHCVNTSENHLKSKFNANAVDVVKKPEVGVFFKNDDVISFLSLLVDEKEKLTVAIDKAKASLNFDVDAAIETNKYRQRVSSAIKSMLRIGNDATSTKRVIQGRDYIFNAEGNQVPYYYDVEITAEKAYDEAEAKRLMRSMISEADKVSSEIDAAMINTTVAYAPPFDVNESFEDVMTEFLGENKTP